MDEEPRRTETGLMRPSLLKGKVAGMEEDTDKSTNYGEARWREFLFCSRSVPALRCFSPGVSNRMCRKLSRSRHAPL